MHYYQHNLGDYQKKTQMLSMMEHGAYRLLLDNYYATHYPVPRDKAEAYRICRAITLAERKAVDAVLKRFFTETSDGFFHERCEKDIEEYIAKSLKAKENGSKGGVAAKEKRVANAIANATANGTANAVANGVANEQLTINHKPITNNQEENTNTPLPPSGETASEATAEKPPRKRSSKTPALTVEQAKLVSIPESLASSESFVSEWQAWLAYRWKEHKPLQADSLSALLERCAKCGPVRSQKALLKGRSSGWVGVFPEKEVEIESTSVTRFTAQPQRTFTDKVSDLAAWFGKDEHDSEP